tara:strand:+ start:1238 stop:1903 length:666 start_codon:yes stop_codon:yes gene_type:complete
MVQHTLLSDDIAHARFACDISRCKGACCVVGDAGAPVSKMEVAVLNKAYSQLKERISAEARNTVSTKGLVQESEDQKLELTCISSGECVFVQYTDTGAANCAIQNAFYEGKFDWEKPISCHLYPLRIKKLSGIEWINYEYIPTLCSAACERAEKEGIYLADFLKKPLIRRYGESWYNEFIAACEHIRTMKEEYSKETRYELNSGELTKKKYINKAGKGTKT